MKSKPKISVIIPCYNYANYVAGAIDCIINQSYKNIEVIVVNDGSKDNSLDIISRYEKQVKIIDKPNGGSVSAYNAGFSEATGDLILFLDADDLIDKIALEAVAAIWHPGCAKVQYDLRIINADGEDLGRRFCNFPADYSARSVAQSFRKTGSYSWPVTAGNVFSRWFAAKIFPLQGERGPDGILNSLAPLYGAVEVVPKVLGSYRIHGANQWSSNGTDLHRLPKRIQDRRRELDILAKHASELGVKMPAEDILNYEMPFVNYRLMAKKLRMQYPGSQNDSSLRLIKAAFRLIASGHFSIASSLVHLIWFLTFPIMPRPISELMIKLRYNRSAIFSSLKKKST